jgi:hypothetical protein
MTREEAQRESDRLAAESPDRETHRFLLREDEAGEWSVVKVGLPPTTDPKAKPESRADSRPSTPDDPRSVYNRNTGGPWVA